MRIKITLITFTLLLTFSCFTFAQIEALYYSCDNSQNIPSNKPITIIYPSEITDTSGLDLNVINLSKYIVFETEENAVAFSAFNDKPNQLTIIPHNDMLGGQIYNISVSPLKFKESGELTESFQCRFNINRYTQEQTVETAYMTSFGNLISSFANGLYPIDTLTKLESYLLPENLSFLNLGSNQAARMRAIAPIFDVMARKPELQEEILAQSINSLGLIDEIGTLSAEAEAERMISLAYLFMATSRQPEIADTLNLLADKLLGIPEDFSTLSDKAKVTRMQSLSMIFDAIARQPEAFRTILNQGLRYHGAIQLLGNTSSEAEGARMRSFAYMFSAIARQPEALDSLILAADTLLGVPDDFTQFDDQVLAMRMQALALIFDASARQPEMADAMLQQAVRYMGSYTDLNPLDSISESMRMYSLRNLWQGIARQPEASEIMCSMVDTLMGIPEDFSALSNFGKEGRIKGLASLFESMARQPEVSDTLISKAIHYCGSAEQVGKLPERALSYGMYVYGSAFESIARQPGIWKKQELAMDTLLGIHNDYSSFTNYIHEGRVRAIEMLFKAISRQPSYCDTLTMLAEKYLGTNEQFSSIPDQSRFYAIGSLIESMLLNFEYADTLDLAAERLIGVPEDFNTLSDEGIYMRFMALNGFLRMYPSDPDILDYTTNILYKYVGKWEQINKENEFSELARIDAFRYLIYEIYNEPSKTSEYLDLFENLLGISEFSNLHESVKPKRHQALLEFYLWYNSSIDDTTSDSLYKASKKILGTNTDFPIETWEEAEMRMEALSYLFREFSNSGGFIKTEPKLNVLGQNKHDKNIFKGAQTGFFEQNSFDEVETTKDVGKIAGSSINAESLEKLVGVIEEFSGNADFSLGSNSKIDYYRQLADGHLTSWLKSNEIHDTLIADARERILGLYTPETPVLFGAPSHSSVNVPVDYKMHLLFTDIMYAYDSTLISTAVFKDSIKLVTIDNEPVPFSLEVNSNNRTINIVPSEELIHGMQYKLIVPECFINFDDSIANSIANQFKVEKATLKVIAEDKEMNEGDAIPELTMIFEGFVDEDSEENITKPEIATEATSTSSPGIYPIVLSVVSSDKYNFEFVNGSLNIIETTGIDFENDNSDVKIFPNPVSNKLYFKSMKEDLRITDIEIINQQGQVVLKQYVEDNKSNINISTLQSGFYIVLFKIDDKSTISCKIMKQ
ncbi:MAG: T9SS type A sorting domain-containing protein [Bacteroidales bacterium]|nr:T9SS type A sorting domain-containing protein [Bacteroidales bacterium]